MKNSQNDHRQSHNDKQALRFVLGMGLAILAVTLICALVWWVAGERSFDVLGQYIIIAAIILIICGIATLALDRAQVGSSRQVWRRLGGESIRAQNTSKVIKKKGNGIRRLMFLCGVGLLCLFIGNLIILGL